MKATLNVPVSGRRNQFNLDCHHETTLNFGSILPAYIRYLAPNEHLTVEAGIFSRVAPLVVPTFGDVRMHLSAFCVPFSACWDKFNDFIEGLPSANPNGNGFVRYNRTPKFYQSHFVQILCGVVEQQGILDRFEFVEREPEGEREENADFSVPAAILNETGSSVPFKILKDGKRFLQIMQALGYKIPFMFERDGNLETSPIKEDQVYNALPLIAFCKLFYDNFVPEQYKPADLFREFEMRMHNLVPDSDGQLYLDAQTLAMLFQLFTLAYKSDYYTSLWEQPNQVVTNQYNVKNRIDDVSQYPSNEESVLDDAQTGSNSAQNSNGVVDMNSTGDQSITPWTVKLAERVQAWFTRHNLAGSDFLNNLLGDFGIKPRNQLGLVRFCGDATVQMQIDPVFDTSSQGLGEFAGRAVMSGRSPKFECTSLEHSLFVLVATVEPVTQFVNGTDRLNFYDDRFDFFHGDFDGLNMQAMPVKELQSNFMFDNEYSIRAFQQRKLQQNRILGFLPRYSERKYGQNRLTGDFMIPTKRTSIEGFALERRLINEPLVNGAFHTIGLKSGRPELTIKSIVMEDDVNQYNRIFAETTGEDDPFPTLFDFRVRLDSPMKPIKDSFEQYAHTGNTVEVEKNGNLRN